MMDQTLGIRVVHKRLKRVRAAINASLAIQIYGWRIHYRFAYHVSILAADVV